MSCTLEINVLSCEDLSIGGRPVRKNTYVIVSTNPLNSHSTSIDTDGGSYPSWHQKVIMDMSPKERFVSLEVRCKRRNGSYKLVGMANIPATDFMGGYLPKNYLNFLSYRLRNAEGYRNGIINVSVKVVKANDVVAPPEYMPGKKKLVGENSRRCNFSSQQPHQLWGGVVTGIPPDWVKS